MGATDSKNVLPRVPLIYFEHCLVEKTWREHGYRPVWDFWRYAALKYGAENVHQPIYIQKGLTPKSFKARQITFGGQLELLPQDSIKKFISNTVGDSTYVIFPLVIAGHQITLVYERTTKTLLLFDPMNQSTVWTQKTLYIFDNPLTTFTTTFFPDVTNPLRVLNNSVQLTYEAEHTADPAHHPYHSFCIIWSLIFTEVLLAASMQGKTLAESIKSVELVGEIYHDDPSNSNQVTNYLTVYSKFMTCAYYNTDKQIQAYYTGYFKLGNDSIKYYHFGEPLPAGYANARMGDITDIGKPGDMLPKRFLGAPATFAASLLGGVAIGQVIKHQIKKHRTRSRSHQIKKHRTRSHQKRRR